MVVWGLRCNYPFHFAGVETRHRDLLQPDQGAPLRHQEQTVRTQPESPTRHGGQTRQRRADGREDPHGPGGQRGGAQES